MGGLSIMAWNWQLEKWPNFQWDSSKLAQAEHLFTEGAGIIAGVTRHMSHKDQQQLSIELLSMEALDTSEIEGEYLNRDSVQSSIQRELGLKVNRQHATPSEIGIAEMMVNLYQTLSQPLTEQTLFDWHRMTMKGRDDLENIGAYRTHAQSMQIVSGADYARTIHFEAPPSKQVTHEMNTFLQWFSNTSPSKPNALPAVTRAGIAHLWFESIHPFEDGNGRIGRAIAEKALSQGFQDPVMTVLASVLLKRRKAYYAALNQASKTLNITNWLLWFASIVIEAQRSTLSYTDFIVKKAKLLEQLHNKLNSRQEKVLLRILKEGPEGFKGGLSAANYMAITGATTATTTRDLQDLVKEGVLKRQGERKATRYHLAMEVKPINAVNLKDLLE